MASIMQVRVLPLVSVPAQRNDMAAIMAPTRDTSDNGGKPNTWAASTRSPSGEPGRRIIAVRYEVA